MVNYLPTWLTTLLKAWYMLWGKNMLTVGDRVRIVSPENPRLHHRFGRVKAVTEYGALVSTSAAGTGQYRALEAELEIITATTPAKEQGYTGDPCDICGSFRVKRTGPCTVCEECGSNSGCS